MIKNYLPNGSFICPLRPYFVRNSIGLNQFISSRWKNMNLITADRLCTLYGWPLRTTRFITILSGFADNTFPVAINSYKNIVFL